MVHVGFDCGAQPASRVLALRMRAPFLIIHTTDFDCGCLSNFLGWTRFGEPK